MKWYYVVVIILCVGLSLLAVSRIRSNPTIDSGFKITPEYFSEIPEKPEDFDMIQRLRVSGVIEDKPDRIDERYWKQVEWMPLPDKFYESVENTANSQYMPWWCVGIYDSQMIGRIENIESFENNTVFTQRFWVRSVPGSMVNMGIKLQSSYPSQKELIGSRRFGVEGMVVSQIPSLAEEKIRIKIIKVCSDSKNCENTDTFVLEPTLPKLSYDYVKEVWFEVEVDKDTEKGWYIVDINAVAPSREFTSDMTYKYLDKKEGYVDPNLGYSCGVPSFSFFVEVR